MQLLHTSNHRQASRAETFNDYAAEFMEHVRKQFVGCTDRVDVVFMCTDPTVQGICTEIKVNWTC